MLPGLDGTGQAVRRVHPRDRRGCAGASHHLSPRRAARLRRTRSTGACRAADRSALLFCWANRFRGRSPFASPPILRGALPASSSAAHSRKIPFHGCVGRARFWCGCRSNRCRAGCAHCSCGARRRRNARPRAPSAPWRASRRRSSDGASARFSPSMRAGSLARIEVPMLVLTATRDRIVPRAATRWLLESARGAQIQEIDGPHLLLQSRPEECAVPVLQFLRRWI